MAVAGALAEDSTVRKAGLLGGLRCPQRTLPGGTLRGAAHPCRHREDGSAVVLLGMAVALEPTGSLWGALTGRAEPIRRLGVVHLSSLESPDTTMGVCGERRPRRNFALKLRA